MPNNQALQIFYGTIPLILVIAGSFLRGHMLLRDILARLGRIEDFMTKAASRLATLEARAGIIFHE